jgi:transcription elongation factor Elf1
MHAKSERLIIAGLSDAELARLKECPYCGASYNLGKAVIHSKCDSIKMTCGQCGKYIEYAINWPSKKGGVGFETT